MKSKDHQSSVTVTKASLILKTLPEKNGKQNGGAEMDAISDDPIERAFRWIETSYDVRHILSYGSHRDAKPDLMTLGNEYGNLKARIKQLNASTPSAEVQGLVAALTKIQTISAHMESKRSGELNKIASQALAPYQKDFL